MPDPEFLDILRKLRKERWMEMLIAQHKRLVAEGFNKMRVVIDYDPLDEVQPDYVVQS